MKKFIILCLIILVFCFFLLSNVIALGITPGRISLDFSPDLKKQSTITIINSDRFNGDLRLFVDGDLKDYISLNARVLPITPAEYEKSFDVSIQLPDVLSPGTHTADIFIVQDVNGKDDGKANVGAKLAVSTQVVVYVPYPGKYIDATFEIKGDNKNKTFSIPVINRGTENLKEVKTVIKVYDLNNVTVKELNTSILALPTNGKGELSVLWSVDSPDGRYNAVAYITYDGESMYMQKGFDLGDILLELQRLYVAKYRLGEPAEFHAVVENKWNQVIEMAYAEMRVFDSQKNEIADVNSQTYNVQPGAKREMVYYWDTSDVEKGLYDASFMLHYAGKSTLHDLQLDIKDDGIDVIGLGYAISSGQGGFPTSSIVIAIIGFLVLLNVLWFIVLRKRRLAKR